MDAHVNVLVSSADQALAQAATEALQQAGYACTRVDDPVEAADMIGAGRYDVVLADLGGGSDAGLALLRAARRSDPACQAIAITAAGHPAEAVAAMREGALYYLQAPVNPAELAMFVDRAAEHVALLRDRERMQTELARRYEFDNIVGNSAAMRKVFRRVSQIADTDVTVLLQGETGTGKELVARAIHYSSGRRHARFVPLNCAGLVEGILESELFGHEKGAFTGAAGTRVGLFEYATGGTLFLDEIGDMPVASQTKLLRVVEHGEIVRVGSNESIPVDVRLIAATNQDLRQKMEDGSFRQDLFYRLNVVTIKLPPLRERQGDSPLLVDRFVRELSEGHGRGVSALDPVVRQVLFRHHWPGNVRELRNCIEHMVVANDDDVLGRDDLPDYLAEQLEEGTQGELLPGMAGQPLQEVEKHHIARTLELVEGNRERAAELLGIGQRTLYRKIEKYGLR